LGVCYGTTVWEHREGRGADQLEGELTAASEPYVNVKGNKRKCVGGILRSEIEELVTGGGGGKNSKKRLAAI